MKRRALLAIVAAWIVCACAPDATAQVSSERLEEGLRSLAGNDPTLSKCVDTIRDAVREHAIVRFPNPNLSHQAELTICQVVDRHLTEMRGHVRTTLGAKGALVWDETSRALARCRVLTHTTRYLEIVVVDVYALMLAEDLDLVEMLGAEEIAANAEVMCGAVSRLERGMRELHDASPESVLRLVDLVWAVERIDRANYDRFLAAAGEEVRRNVTRAYRETKYREMFAQNPARAVLDEAVAFEDRSEEVRRVIRQFDDRLEGILAERLRALEEWRSKDVFTARIDGIINEEVSRAAERIHETLVNEREITIQALRAVRAAASGDEFARLSPASRVVVSWAVEE